MFFRNAKTLVPTVFVALLVSACSPTSGSSFTSWVNTTTASLGGSSSGASPVSRWNGTAKGCLVRAMYFESNRSSESGMLAVGTVVMNRVASSRFPNSVCAVVGAPRQFAPGVLTRAMTEQAPVALAGRVADRVLRGERHRGVRSAKFFHQAGLRFPYGNMTYVAEAGGNEFYIKG